MKEKTRIFWDKGIEPTILAQVSTDPGRTAAASRDGITAGTIFTFTGEGAVFTKESLGACCKKKKKITAQLSRLTLLLDTAVTGYIYACMFVCEETHSGCR